ncbi:flagellar hook protein FlgE [Comamonas terrigena]|jgi:flagellar hook protein FlgE|uniref:flagellar hook protein FlgE n=1 Tax=Comamonas terrigena TaxID=32013 RepID=UPI002448E085|nr:flagellar hook-basal body complex protein [Comamonas terrigena]MDH0049130.1 flagellar hook-basal body complex protein [Comamonas terrigena]MDH0512081.1 flagellar hook-basal body complex protein [Comamonas terrigena]MDH1091541.1 flagellar hook-basal body complex protein [Comamonas terrigena]MDH1500478.1 flagellar hook-basal body complex protein [Comamonas terrigena]
MSFQIALSALQAINNQLDNISQNIANTGTTGYKSSRTNFAAMYASSSPNGVRAASTTQTLDVAGGLLSTGRNLDVAIAGNGYFMVKDSTGVMNYTRVGVFDVDKQGVLVDHMGRQVQGYGVTAGNAALGNLGNLTVPTGQIPAQASTSVDFVANLSADWSVPANAFNPTDSSSYNSSTVSVVYDSLGRQHTVTQYFVKTANNTVEVHYQNENTAVGTSTLKFTNAGQLDTAASTVAAVNLTPAGANALSVTFDYAGTTQFAGDTSTTTNASDGYASGTMVNVLVGADGSVNAQYSNGMVQSVGVIALATFPSDSGLTAVDGTSWQASAKSGAALIGTPGTGQLGELESQQLEQSNVEVASELVDLMGAQRNYQANTKVISTQNEIMQSLMQVM